MMGGINRPRQKAARGRSNGPTDASFPTITVLQPWHATNAEAAKAHRKPKKFMDPDGTVHVQR